MKPPCSSKQLVTIALLCNLWVAVTKAGAAMWTGSSAMLSDSIMHIAEEANAVSRANGVLTVQLAPDQILAALSLEFADDFKTP